MEKIKIKYFDKDITRLNKITIGDWIDLRAAEDVELKPGDFKLIPLGVAMELPKGYEAIVAPRSSTFTNYGIIETNSIGVIDNSYCGDSDQWFYPAYCIHGKTVENGNICTRIKKNDRICQFRIIKNQPEIEFEEVDSLGNADRGGHGSTGVE